MRQPASAPAIVEESAGVGADRIRGQAHLGAGEEVRGLPPVEGTPATGHHHQIDVGCLPSQRLAQGLQGHAADLPRRTLEQGFDPHPPPEHQQLLPPQAQGRLQGQGLGTAPVLRREVTNVDLVVVTGGGGALYGHQAADLFPGAEVRLARDPVGANAQGFFHYGRR